MKNHHFKLSILIGFTFLVGMIVTILPLPIWTVWYQPSWIFIILLFWIITVPHRVSIGIAFVVGLLLDLLTGTVLGQHALSFVCFSYFFGRFRIFINNLATWQQTILILIATAINLTLQYWIMKITNSTLPIGKHWISLVSTTFLWLCCRSFLHNYQRKFALYHDEF
ncbi:rod shape-determining protein MreD [Coxiella endosymbiont of Amblyomma americanum]|uniref:rod shape-determining protein MreD n=1 Tax=Coxiella endosymbiont of Amblyomma americanum TaxID=325775 RepID=UPI00057FE409|nr:rod shape-determining protein MreD [Coxiella endosymbiont of Amblyomma americanum]AJC50263.1 rod shape-determining protein MreD [Coxiella endosymbiont of Amblyomma americanum]AUJ58620.1 rod shape-determining protein MreD [Coxiella-like endosymbiont of Amblyomma americanum]